MLETSTNGAGAVEAAAAGREDERAVGELGFVAGGRAAPEGVGGPEQVPDPELVEQAKRRSFTAEYKARILARADACTRPGEVGELLRAEGLYTSHLTYWRKQRKDGALKELGKPRGRKPADNRDAQITALTRRAERAEIELAKMKRVVEIQGNVSALLEEMLGADSAHRSTER
jgi:transposase-like protein